MIIVRHYHIFLHYFDLHNLQRIIRVGRDMDALNAAAGGAQEGGIMALALLTTPHHTMVSDNSNLEKIATATTFLNYSVVAVH